jgi:hypothetical protein
MRLKFRQDRALSALFIITSHDHCTPVKPRTSIGRSENGSAPTSLGLSPSVVPRTQSETNTACRSAPRYSPFARFHIIFKKI